MWDETHTPNPCTLESLNLLCYAHVLLLVVIIYYIKQLTPGWGKLMGHDLVSCYDGLMVSCSHILEGSSGGHQWFCGVYWHLIPPVLSLLSGMHKPLGLFLWVLHYPTLIGAYNKSRYLAVHFGSVPDTPWLLSRASMGPILNMVHRTPSIFK